MSKNLTVVRLPIKKPCADCGGGGPNEKSLGILMIVTTIRHGQVVKMPFIVGSFSFWYNNIEKILSSRTGYDI